MSVSVANVQQVIERWSRDQVLAVAPDASSQKAAQGVAAPGKWAVRGVVDEVLFGECAGSGATPYRACVDLAEPAYRCSCPSRKFPCKHALGLLLLWSAGGVEETSGVPGWAGEWMAQRANRAAKSTAKRETASPQTPVRHARVAAGLSELERWLGDQVRQGLSAADRRDWDDLAKRLVDAQAPGVAGLVGRLGRIRGEADWPGRLLEEYALLNLLAVAYRRRDSLPEDLAQTVLTRVGFPTAREDVLAGPAVRDRWHVLGRRDRVEDNLTSRRVWLRGRDTGRAALILSFAPTGQPLDASLVTGTTVDADLAFYPGAAPLRALLTTRHQTLPGSVPPGVSVEGALDEVARVLAADPWVASWPLVLTGVVPEATTLGGLPLHPGAHDPWRLIAVAGGRPVTVAAEWTPRGLAPLTTWDDDGQVVIL